MSAENSDKIVRSSSGREGGSERYESSRVGKRLKFDGEKDLKSLTRRKETEIIVEEEPSAVPARKRDEKVVRVYQRRL